jgi:hypothetical protein
MDTPLFSSLVYFNNVCRDFMYSIFCLTEAEAARMGKKKMTNMNEFTENIRKKN